MPIPAPSSRSIRRPKGGVPLGWREGPDGRLVPDPDERRARELALAARRRNPKVPLRLIAEMLDEVPIPTRSKRPWTAEQVRRLLACDPGSYARHNDSEDVEAMTTIMTALRDNGPRTVDQLATETGLVSGRVLSLTETLADRGKIRRRGTGLHAMVSIRR